MLFLVNIILTLWVSWARGQESACDPPRIANSHFDADRSKYRLGDSITYSCRDGFYPSSQGNTTKCTAIGWDAPPRCIFKPCAFLEIKHGQLYWEDRYRYRRYFAAPIGRWFYYICDENYVSPSHFKWDRMTCTRDGWTPKVPCLRECIFNDLENGHRPQSPQKYLQGASVNVTCYPGYMLQNKRTSMTCTENGWHPPPRCIRVETCVKSKVTIENGFIADSESIYLLNQKVKYECRQDYVTEDGHTSGYITCLQNGWSAQPRCIKTICPSPPSYGNAILIGQPKSSYKSGEQVIYICPDYYQMDGSHFVECRGGIWLGTPTCKDLSCGSPPPVQNAFISEEKPRYRHGDTARYECTNSLGLFGNAVVTCLSGKWTDPPECKDSTGKCGPPPVIDNGDITTYPSPLYASGSSVEYQCQAYYELEGNRRITCHDGEWSEPPKCLDACVISEEAMGQHHIALKRSHEKILYSRTNEYIEFRCRPGYREVSPASAFRAQCREGKMEYPTCA